MSALGEDIRHGVRVMYRHPKFTLGAVLALGLGIGSSTTMFSVVSGFLFRPLPFPDPGSLVKMLETYPRGVPRAVSPAILLEWRKQTAVFSGISAIRFMDFTVAGRDRPEVVDGAIVSHSLFELLGVRPALGRPFQPEDERPSNPPAALLSHAFWQRRFGGDPAALGQKLALDGSLATVIGVLPRDFWFFGPRADVWTAVRWQPGDTSDPGKRILHLALGRLAPGAALEQAQARAATVSRAVERTFPNTNTGWGVRLTRLQESQVEDLRPAFVLLLGAVGCVLLTTCANVANLLLARAASRRTEMALRAALGASAGRLLRQALTESVLLGIAGGAFGLLLTFWGASAVAAILPDEIRGRVPASAIQIDWTVLAFAAAVSFLAGLVFGIAPAFAALRASLSQMMQKGGRGERPGAGRTARNLLIAGEVAVSLVLVTGAGLMIRGILRLESTHPGFNPDNLMLVGIAPIPEKYPRPIQKINYYRQVLERVQTLPGVRSAGAQHPGIEAPWSFGVEVEGRPLADPSQAVIVRHRMVDPNFFATTGIPLIQGRLFGAFDGPEAPKVAVISQSAARSLFPGEDPIGRRIRDQRLSTFPWMTVIGVVGDVRYYNAEPELRPSLYRSYLQFPPVWLELIVRADNPSQLFRSLSREIWALDSEQSIEGPETVQDVISRVTSPSKFLAKLLAAFAGLSLALAALGIYSVTAYLASQRVRELGIRVALGALPGHLFRLVLGDTFKAALAGVVAGLLASSSLSRLLEGHLHGVLPYDLLTLGAVSLLMLAVALLAAWAPASRARRVDPASVLRYE